MNDSNRRSGFPAQLPDEPMHCANAWLEEAIGAGITANPNAMMLATVGAGGQPSSRVVLCKQFVPDPGYLVFYTNYHSRKGRELLDNAQSAALFHWDALGRQVRIEGTVVRSPAEESDAYFASRGRGSQLGAWGSDQSAPIASKDALIAQIRQRGENLGLSLRKDTQEVLDDNDTPIERPPHWGGFRLWATQVELWLEGADRIHDRGSWSRKIIRGSDDRFSTTDWIATRLQP